MAETPPMLTVVDTASKPNPLAPPAELGDAGRALWCSILHDFHVDDSAGRETLFQLCMMTDRAAQCAEAIKRDGGPVIRVKGVAKAHPAVRDELQARSFVVRSLSRMGFDVIPPRSEPGRPSGGGDYRGTER